MKGYFQTFTDFGQLEELVVIEAFNFYFITKSNTLPSRTFLLLRSERFNGP